VPDLHVRPIRDRQHPGGPLTAPAPTSTAWRDIPVPARIARLPRDKHDRPLPWFVVAGQDGQPDFRLSSTAKVHEALRFHLCWVCGQTLGTWQAFLIGPMCAVNRTTAEPPSHRDCATYSAQVCPFLAIPGMRRRDTGLPDDKTVPGEMLARNPGVCVLWVVRGRRWVLFPDGKGGMLFDVGDPADVEWWAQGRAATREEVLASIDGGMPFLQEQADAEGPDALAELVRMRDRALTYAPAA
jgi:hypothetical protein